MEINHDSIPAQGNLDIAIVGMAGRFPGANTIEEFWSNLVQGIESISWCSEQEVIDSGFHPEIARDPDFIPAAGKLEDEYKFDADFFGIAPREAQLMDPQHRVLLECAWEALESAGYNPESCSGRVGVYAGASTNTYFPFHIAPNTQLLSSVGLLQAITANDKDFLASRIAYKLNLKGPALSVQTACSTSLVAVNLACQSLNQWQCDMALAGGVSVTPKGRLYKDGFIFARDGHCRPFDEAASGAVFGNGLGMVVLKRLDDAVAHGDFIYAIIKGSAVNNDGSLKAGYTAPSVSGQMEAIVEAHALSGVPPQTIRYIEAHGTGTALGDPIEVAALTEAFQAGGSSRKSYCAIGSVKGNIGHLDAAAGIAGLIKTALVLDRKQIPPTLHFRKVNPRLNLSDTPFFVNTELQEWPADEFPRRAAVSSFGFGGTNAHAVLEEAPPYLRSVRPRDWHLLPISARTGNALRASSLKLADFFDNHPSIDLEDAAFTLQLGRKHFRHRGFAVVHDASFSPKIFRSENFDDFQTGESPEKERRVIFMFPGQGSQVVNMAREIYESEPLFRETMERCARLASQYLDRELIDLIYPQENQTEESNLLLARTEYAQPALFAVEFALAILWQSWGIEPAAMIGHSLGEYVAACMAGVFSLEDAVQLICARGAAMQQQPTGAMLSVPLGELDLSPLLPDDLCLAAVNGPALCVVSGPALAIDRFRNDLESRGISGRLLRTSHAFHSKMMEAARSRFKKVFDNVKLLPPEIPFISNVTGDWAKAEDVCNPEYWVQHLLSPVRFHQGCLRIMQDPHVIFLEVGPGHALTALVNHCSLSASPVEEMIALSSCSRKAGFQRAHLLSILGKVWLHGANVNWQVLHTNTTCRRIPLPTYPFQRKLYWLPPVHSTSAAAAGSVQPEEMNVASSEQKNDFSGSSSIKETELEKIIAGIWQELLGIDEFGLEDDFFVQGGNSLIAIQLIATIRRRTGVEVSVKNFFQDPTVSGLVGMVRDSRGHDAVNESPAIQIIPREGDLPLTFHQQDVWEFETGTPETARFTGVISMSLHGELMNEGIEFAINEILTRHEVLRTTYRATRNGPVAQIHPPQLFQVPFTDISHRDTESRRRELLDAANRLVRTPFDLGSDVLLRVQVFKTGAREHVLLLSSHYIAVDGWTVGLIVKELGEHYGAYIEKRPANVPEVKLQCVDYAHWQRSQFSRESLAPHLEYWREQLFDVATQEPVLLDCPRPQAKSMAGATFHFALTAELTRGLKRFSHQHGSTLFFTLLSALNVLFYLRSGSEDIVIGTITGDREPGMETLFGSFVNCLPLRNRLHAGLSFLKVMENARRCTAEAYAHQVPFHKITEILAQERDVFNHPLFRVTLVLRNIPFTEIKTGGVNIQLFPLEVNRAVSDRDLSLYLQDIGGALSGYFEYDHEIFKAETAESLAKDFVRLLEQVTTEPETRLCDCEGAMESGRIPGKGWALSYAN